MGRLLLPWGCCEIEVGGMLFGPAQRRKWHRNLLCLTSSESNALTAGEHTSSQSQIKQNCTIMDTDDTQIVVSTSTKSSLNLSLWVWYPLRMWPRNLNAGLLESLHLSTLLRIFAITARGTLLSQQLRNYDCGGAWVSPWPLTRQIATLNPTTVLQTSSPNPERIWASHPSEAPNSKFQSFWFVHELCWPDFGANLCSFLCINRIWCKRFASSTAFHKHFYIVFFESRNMFRKKRNPRFS